MLISRTPFRVSFVGGGTDLPQFYRKYGGAVVNMAIKKYFYLSLHEHFHDRQSLIKYSKTEAVTSIDEIEHPIIREVFRDYDISGVDFSSTADIPAGTGLGSSSAFTVSLITLCKSYQWKYASKAQIAEEACHIEIERLGEPIGKQDQYACSLGGLNYMRFNPDNSVSLKPMYLDQQAHEKLERNLMMFYLGGTRSASALLKEQAVSMANSSQVIENMKHMSRQAQGLCDDLIGDPDVLGHYLHDGWERKRRLSSGISSPEIDRVYTLAIQEGATGGKLLGAGGGGFLLVYAKPEHQDSVRHALKDYACYSLKMDVDGTLVIYDDRV